jgi:hypothetical protein
LAIIIILAIVIFAGVNIYRFIHFGVISTDPAANAISSVTPSFAVKFNRSLDKSSLQLDSSQSLVASYQISGKVLKVVFNTPMNPKGTYFITIKSIADTKGNTIVNKKFIFTPKDVAFQNLPKNQQQQILNNQTQKPLATRISGADALLTYGLTQAQEAGLRQAIAKFAPNANFAAVISASISPEPHNRNSANTSDNIDFQVNIDGKTYNAKVNYSNLTVIRLFLYDPLSGSQIFDSGDISG